MMSKKKKTEKAKPAKKSLLSRMVKKVKDTKTGKKEPVAKKPSAMKKAIGKVVDKIKAMDKKRTEAKTAKAIKASAIKGREVKAAAQKVAAPVKTVKALPKKPLAPETLAIKAQAEVHYEQPKTFPTVAPGRIIPEPPPQYGITRIIALPRDPDWAYTYWEITEDTIKNAANNIGQQQWSHSIRLLRVYDITDVNFNGSNAHSSFDIEISPYASNWYLKMPESNRNYIIDIGILTPDGKFILLARSNSFTMPRAGVSDILDEEWMTINYEELFRLSGGLGTTKSMGSAFMIEEVSKRMMQELSMGSAAVSSFSGKKQEQERKFWLVVNTELIVYGATEPDAKLTVQDVPVKLNADGTFSMRFALPDGLQIIPVKAISADGIDERKITPVVKKVTE